MKDEDIRDIALRALGEIAPEADLARLEPNVSLSQQLDIDSMDFLNFLIALDAALHIEIPEADARKLDTLDGCVAYLRSALRTRGPSA